MRASTRDMSNKRYTTVLLKQTTDSPLHESRVAQMTNLVGRRLHVHALYAN